MKKTTPVAGLFVPRYTREKKTYSHPSICCFVVRYLDLTSATSFTSLSGLPFPLSRSQLCARISFFFSLSFSPKTRFGRTTLFVITDCGLRGKRWESVPIESSILLLLFPYKFIRVLNVSVIIAWCILYCKLMMRFWWFWTSIFHFLPVLSIYLVIRLLPLSRVMS